MTPQALALSAELAVELDTNASDTRAIRLRSSHLKAIAQSPAHARWAMLNDRDQTLSMRIGSATHSLTFGGPTVVVFPGKTRRGKEWDAFAEMHKGSIIVSRKEFQRAQAMAKALRTNPVSARVLFGDGFINEQTIEWEWNGRAMRCTPDVRSMRHLVDLKTCRTAEPEKFMWDAVRMGYHAQLALYAQAMATVHPSGAGPTDVYIVAVESNPPHDVVVRRLTPSSLEVGARLNKTWFDRFMECEAANHWPGYAESVVDMDVPLEPVDLIFADDNNAEGDE